MSEIIQVAEESPTVVQVFSDLTINNIGGENKSWQQLSSNIIAINNTNYLVNNSSASPVQVILPVNAGLGFIFTVLSVSGTYQITQNQGQQIRFGNILTTNGMSGRITSLDDGDCIQLACIGPPTVWAAMLVIGNISFF